MKFFVVLSALAFSLSAFAADGTSSLRIGSGRILSFDYSADLAQSHVSGSLERGGYMTVEYSNTRAGGWGGNIGGTGVNTAPIQTQEGGRKVVEISTIKGLLRYTFETNAKGDLYIRAIGPATGSMLQAEMTAKGAFSLATPDYSFEVSRDKKNPTKFHGTVVLNWEDLDTDYVDMQADGSLDPNALAKADPALFIILYVVPFHMGY